ncbi:hypothetical protein EVAR_59952_1 [Eumeta japonica]|uniref:Uncharacterized protein n=1 Tax=Eumeta variegata TaxID=151549 RepID=A0A4C1YNL7_EUMVA|nr:hypothetical protein EVAR_59952_1 [Eumeta japonica]
MGRLPSEDIKKSPLFRRRMVACRRETLPAGPSKLRRRQTVRRASAPAAAGLQWFEWAHRVTNHRTRACVWFVITRLRDMERDEIRQEDTLHSEDGQVLLFYAANDTRKYRRSKTKRNPHRRNNREQLSKDVGR